MPMPWKMAFISKQSPCLYIYTLLPCPVLKVSPEQVRVSSPSLQTPATWWQWWCSGCPSRTVPQQAGQPAGHRQQVTHGNIVRAFIGLDTTSKLSVNAHLCVHNRQCLIRTLRITTNYVVYDISQTSLTAISCFHTSISGFMFINMQWWATTGPEWDWCFRHFSQNFMDSLDELIF